MLKDIYFTIIDSSISLCTRNIYVYVAVSVINYNFFQWCLQWMHTLIEAY